MPTKNLALLIDGDNAPSKYTKHIIQFCKVFGTLSIKNAYGDWNQPPLSTKSNKIMTSLGVKRVQQNRDGKNATDKKLQAEVRSMLDKGEVDIYFLISSDNHFAAVCEEIIQKGAKVIGIGSENNASKKLRTACTLFFVVEEIIKNQKTSTKSSAPKPKTETIKESAKKLSAPSTKSPATSKSKTKAVAESVKKQSELDTKPPATPKGKPKVEGAKKPSALSTQSSPAIKPKTILKMLLQAYNKTPQTNGRVYLSQLEEQFSELEQQTNLKIPKKPILKCLKEFPDKFKIIGDYVRMVD